MTLPTDPTPDAADPVPIDAESPITEHTADGRGIPDPAPGIGTDVSAALRALAGLPVEEHPEVYEAVHRRLGDTLSGIDHV